MTGKQAEESTERIDTPDELELSVHHTIAENPLRSDEMYEIHAGTADVLRIPKSLVETAYTVTGVDIRDKRVCCGAKIKVVQDE
jgi:hypothetical protein